MEKKYRKNLFNYSFFASAYIARQYAYTFLKKRPRMRGTTEDFINAYLKERDTKK